MIADGVVAVTSKNAKLEDPPPGAGFTTVTMPVPGCARLEAGTAAVTLSAPTNVVGRACPFHCTTDPETNPAPLTVTVTPCVPGFALVCERLADKRHWIRGRLEYLYKDQ
jgi:hypothetical protein